MGRGEVVAVATYFWISREGPFCSLPGACVETGDCKWRILHHDILSHKFFLALIRGGRREFPYGSFFDAPSLKASGLATS